MILDSHSYIHEPKPTGIVATTLAKSPLQAVLLLLALRKSRDFPEIGLARVV